MRKKKNKNLINIEIDYLDGSQKTFSDVSDYNLPDEVIWISKVETEYVVPYVNVKLITIQEVISYGT